MPTLVLKLAGPMQSWGISSKFNKRNSGSRPSKSGVIGLIASAQGRSRTDTIDDLASLKFGVRIDQPGHILMDYHTACREGKSFVTNRQYLSDAIFVVGLEGSKEKLEQIAKSIQHPVYPLFLGRRSCPPSANIVLGIEEGNVEDILKNYEWQASEWYRKKNDKYSGLEIEIDDENGTICHNDLPVSFNQDKRKHTIRFTSIINVKNVPGYVKPEQFVDHDPIAFIKSGEY